MLKYDDVLILLNSTKEITSKIQSCLNDTPNDKFVEITSYYSERKPLLVQLQKYFESNVFNDLAQRNRELINNIVQEIIMIDKQNISGIEQKVNIVKNSVKQIQKQKSLLIYNKS